MPQTYLDDNGNPISAQPIYLDEQGNPVGYRPPSFEQLKRVTETYPKQGEVPGLLGGVQDYTYPGGEVGPIAPGETALHAGAREVMAAPGGAARTLLGTPGAVWQAFDEPPKEPGENILQYIPGALPVKRLITDPMLEEQAKVIPSWKAGRPFSAAIHAAASRLPVAGSWLGGAVSEAEKGHVGAAPQFGLEYAGFKGAGKVAPEIKARVRTALTTSPIQAMREGWKNIAQSLTTGTKFDFPEHMERLFQRGHLKEFTKTFNPDTITVRGAHKILRKYKHKWDSETIGAAIKRHPEGIMSGDAIANEVLTLKEPYLNEIFPEEVKVIEAEAARYAGKQIPISTGRQLLAKLNAITETLQNKTVEGQVSAERASASKAALAKATEAVRDQLYTTLENLGEKGIRETQRDYGSMSELQDVLASNVMMAERAEASKPGYNIFERSITRHPWMAGTVGSGLVATAIGTGHPGVMAGLAALPVVEAWKTIKERRTTPNAFLQKALKSYAKGPERAPLPTPSEPIPPVSGPSIQSEPAPLQLPPAGGFTSPVAPPIVREPIITPPPPGPVTPPREANYKASEHPTQEAFRRAEEARQAQAQEASSLAGMSKEDIDSFAALGDEPAIAEQQRRSLAEQPPIIPEPEALPLEVLPPEVTPQNLEQYVQDTWAPEPQPPLKEAPPIPGTVRAFKGEEPLVKELETSTEIPPVAPLEEPTRAIPSEPSISRLLEREVNGRVRDLKDSISIGESEPATDLELRKFALEDIVNLSFDDLTGGAPPSYFKKEQNEFNLIRKKAKRELQKIESLLVKVEKEPTRAVPSEPEAKSPLEMTAEERAAEGWVGPVYRGTNAQKAAKEGVFFTSDKEYAKPYSSTGPYTGSYLKHEPDKVIYDPDSVVESYYVRNAEKSVQQKAWGIKGEADVYKISSSKDAVKIPSPEIGPVRPISETPLPTEIGGVKVPPGIVVKRGAYIEPESLSEYGRSAIKEGKQAKLAEQREKLGISKEDTPEQISQILKEETEKIIADLAKKKEERLKTRQGILNARKARKKKKEGIGSIPTSKLVDDKLRFESIEDLLDMPKEVMEALTWVAEKSPRLFNLVDSIRYRPHVSVSMYHPVANAISIGGLATKGVRQLTTGKSVEARIYQIVHELEHAREYRDFARKHNLNPRLGTTKDKWLQNYIRDVAKEVGVTYSAENYQILQDLYSLQPLEQGPKKLGETAVLKKLKEYPPEKVNKILDDLMKITAAAGFMGIYSLLQDYKNSNEQ